MIGVEDLVAGVGLIGGSYLMGEGYAKLAGYPRGKVGIVFVISQVAILVFHRLNRSFISNSDTRACVGHFFGVVATEWVITRLEKDQCIGNRFRAFLMISQGIQLGWGLIHLGKRVGAF